MGRTSEDDDEASVAIVAVSGFTGWLTNRIPRLRRRQQLRADAPRPAFERLERGRIKHGSYVSVLEALIDRLLEHEPPSGRAGTPAAARLPDDGTIAQVYGVLAQTDAPGLMDLGGGTYDGMVALLVATLAAVDDSAADRTGAPS